MWKYNNQGVKEETFIQTHRRDREWKLAWRGLVAMWQLGDQAVPHLCVDKPGGTTWELDRLTQGSREGEKSLKTSE